jgi:phosphoribosyl 1,2-cyclic phosphodiesterase
VVPPVLSLRLRKPGPSSRYPIADRRLVQPGRHSIAGIRFKPVAVQHSLRAPAVSYRISANGVSFFYVPDVALIPDSAKALRGVSLYIGDGATVVRSMVRQRGQVAIGHASIVAQLRWCEAAGVKRAIFTHCGSGIVRHKARAMNARISKLGKEHGIEASIAHDRLTLSL